MKQKLLEKIIEQQLENKQFEKAVLNIMKYNGPKFNEYLNRYLLKKYEK